METSGLGVGGLFARRRVRCEVGEVEFAGRTVTT